MFFSSNVFNVHNEGLVVLWCSGYHCCTTSFNYAWTQVLHKFKSCLQRVGDLRGSLTMVPTGNKAKPLSPVNHTRKTIHHHCHHHQRLNLQRQWEENTLLVSCSDFFYLGCRAEQPLWGMERQEKEAQKD